LLEEDAFMRGMLVDEDEAFRAFGYYIELRDAADDVEAEAVGDERLGTRRGALREGFFREGKRGLKSEGFRFALQL
jgi:hypothetical protein